MFAHRFALVTCLLTLACANAEGIDTDLQRDPPRGALRVVSLLPEEPVDFTVTVEDEAPVSFAGLEVGVTAWRHPVAGEATGWVLRGGSPVSSAPLTLGSDAQVTALVTAPAATPRVSWVVESFPAGELSPHVRFINGLVSSALTASVEGAALGGQLDPGTTTAWFAIDEAAQAEVVVEDAAATYTFGPVSLAASASITLAAFPGATEEAPPRLLVFRDTVENAAPQPAVLEANIAP